MRIRRSGFTLIELLVVIAIIAILAVVVVLTLNPAELLRQARDSNRISDISTIRNAVSLYLTDANTTSTVLGTASTTYTSVIDLTATTTAGTNCGTLGLMPATGWTYHCPASSTYRNPTTLGWIPINFSGMTMGNPLSALPVDPTNSTSGYFYSFVPGANGNFALTALLESNKYLKPIGSNGSNYDLARYTIGSNLALVGSSEGLVRNWPYEEGTGTITAEISGAATSPDNGTFSGQAASNDWSSLAAKIGTGAAQLIQGGQIAYATNSALPNASAISVTAWVAVSSTAGHANFNYLTNNIANPGGWNLGSDSSGNIAFTVYDTSDIAHTASGCASSYTTGSWHFAVGTYDGTTVKVYLDGNTTPCGTSALANQTLYSGGTLISTAPSGPTKTVWFDDMRVLARTLPPAEIAALYKAEN